MTKRFEVKKVTKIESLISGEEKVLPTSDLTIQDNGNIVQFEYKEDEEPQKKYKIKTGAFVAVQTMQGVDLHKVELKQPEVLSTIDNTKIILDEKDKFFSKLDLYNKVKTLKGRPVKRAVLLTSPPGVGKSTAIAKIASTMLEDKDAAIIIWNTTEVKSSMVNNFFTTSVEYDSKVKKLFLIIEDIGGGVVEDYHGPKGVDSSLLNFLEGATSAFAVPTFILATTNNPEQSVGALIDRPGRFDKVIELKTPSEKECQELLAFIAERDLTDEENKAAAMAAKEHFSIAHLQEVVVRSLLDDKSFLQVVEELIKHKKRFANAFQDLRPSMGLR